MKDNHCYVVAARFPDGKGIWVRRCDTEKDREDTIASMVKHKAEEKALVEVRKEKVIGATEDELLNYGQQMLSRSA